MNQPPLPEGSVPGTAPYVPSPHGRETPLPPSHRSAATLAVSLLLFFGLPVLAHYLATSGEPEQLLTMLVVGGVLCFATCTFAIVVYARTRKNPAERPALAIVAAVLSILAIVPMLTATFFGVMAGAAHGRPLRRRDGRATVTPEATTAAWSASGVTPDVSALDAATRAALARAWRRDAALEHASVAAFGRLALDLVALGAPPDLIAGTHRAALDEIEHARVAYAIASGYAGVPIGAGAMPEAAIGSTRESHADRVARVVFESVVDGMAGEGSASSIASLVAARTDDAIVRAALERVAVEEARHAALAGRIVDFYMERERVAASRGLERGLAALRASHSADLALFDAVALPGRPSRRETEEARRDERRRVLERHGAAIAAAA